MAQTNSKTPRGDALQQKVLDTCLQLFSEQGYFNTSIQDIRKAAGVSTGAIYHHFANKEHLAKSLYSTLLSRIESAISDVLQQESDCWERSSRIISLLFELTMDEPKMMQFVLLAKHREYLPEEPPICSSQPFTLMRSVLEQGIERGEVRAMEPWVATTAMFGGALRMMNLQLDGALEHPLPHYLDEVIECGWRAVSR